MIFDLPFSLAAFGLAIILLPSYFIGYAIYNLFFHPLRKYPGPKLAAATKLPNIWARYQGRLPFWCHALHEQYGDVVRVGPNELSYINPEAWRDIHGHKIQGKGSIPKDLRLYGPDSAGKNSIIRANDPDHARQRRLLAHAFSDKALREQEPLIRTYVDLLVEKLSDISRTPNASTDILKFLNCTTFDIMGDLTFGEPLGLLEQSEYTPWVAAIFSTLKMGNLIALIKVNVPLISGLVMMFLPKTLVERRKLHRDLTVKRVDKRLARQTDRPDIWTFVLRHNDEKGMPLHEMHATGSLLMIAGTETTATLLSGLTYHLLQNRHILDKLVAEIRGTFATPADMTMTSLAQMPFMQACLEEALRMYPPVPIGLPRLVPPEGRTICGEPVCGGTTVYITQWAAYHSPRNFHDPESFLPERWLPNPEPRFALDQRNVLEPFSFGPRNCIGKNLAYHEMRLILANVLWNFDIQLCDESRTWTGQKVYTLYEKPPLMVKLTPAARG